MQKNKKEQIMDEKEIEIRDKAKRVHNQYQMYP